MTKINYLDLVGFENSEEAYRKIKEWSSDMTDDEHLVRSVILDVHLGIEMLIRQIFYHFMKTLVFQSGDKEDKKHLASFEKMINKLSFSLMHRLLKPIFNSWPKPDLASIRDIDLLRNQVSHNRGAVIARYKGRNPFKDPDSFAQLFFDAWAVRQELKEFYQKAISEPLEMSQFYYSEYNKLSNKDEKQKRTDSR